MTEQTTVSNRISKNVALYWVASLVWALFVMLFAVVVIKNGLLAFETNDDALLNLFASGALGDKYATNVFNNVVLGWFLTALYSVASAHNWFTIIGLFLYFVGIIVLGICIIRRSGILRGYLINLIVVGASAHTMLARMNFSKTGAFALLVGVFLLGTCADGDSFSKFEKRIFQVVGVFFVVVGGLFRIDSIYAILLFVLLLFIYLFIKYKTVSFRVMAPLACAFVILCLAWIGNNIAYSSNPAWKEYTEYNKARSKVLDYGVPDYNEHVAEYEALGLSQNDVTMLSCWEIADRDVFTADKLNKIAEIREKDEAARPLFTKIKDLLVSFAKTVIANKSIFVLIAFLLTLCFFSNRKSIVFGLVATILGVGEIAGLVLVNRALERSVFIAIISALIFVIFFATEDYKQVARKELAGLGVIAFCSVGLCAYAWVGQVGNSYDKEVPNSFFNYCSEHPDSLFIYELTIEEEFMMKYYSPLDAVNEVSRENAIMKGGWPLQSPVYTKLLEPFGDKYNMYKILAENRLAYWITAPGVMKDIFVEYMQAHYGVLPTVVDTAPGGYEVISFSE